MAVETSPKMSSDQLYTFAQGAMKFQKFLIQLPIFYWLSDWCLQTSITQKKWLGLQAWFHHCSMSLHPKTWTFANHSSYKAWIVVLPKLSFVLHSFLHCRIGGSRVMALWISYCSDCRSASHAILLFKTFRKMLDTTENKAL